MSTRACRTLIMLTVLAVLAAALPAAARTVALSEPRPFGYFIGDRVERTITVETGPNEEFLINGLPEPGAQNYWLDLVDRQVTTAPAGQGQMKTVVRLVYQIFYSALEPRAVKLPQLTLRFRARPGAPTSDPVASEEKIQAYPVVVSPIREILLGDVTSEREGGGPLDALRPDTQAHRLHDRSARVIAALSAAAALFSGAGLLWVYALWPFRAAANRPFTRSLRTVERLAEPAADAGFAPVGRYEAQLLSLHRAFDAAFGQRLLAQDLPEFFALRPAHNASREQIESFFAGSQEAFFAGALDRAEALVPPAEILDLSRRLAREERAYA